MATRSNIVVQLTNGLFKKVYCHSDGYLSWNGMKLYEHYNTQALAEKLVEPGDISVIFEKCDKPSGHTYNTRTMGYTVYYGRDRGEDDVDGEIATLDALFAASDWEEYAYLWRDGQWWVDESPGENTCLETFTPLVAALVRDKVLAGAGVQG